MDNTRGGTGKITSLKWTCVEYSRTSSIRVVKNDLLEIKIQQMWQCSDGSTEWRYVDEIHVDDVEKE